MAKIDWIRSIATCLSEISLRDTNVDVEIYIFHDYVKLFSNICEHTCGSYSQNYWSGPDQHAGFRLFIADKRQKKTTTTLQHVNPWVLALVFFVLPAVVADWWIVSLTFNGYSIQWQVARFVRVSPQQPRNSAYWTFFWLTLSIALPLQVSWSAYGGLPAGKH